MEMSFSSKNIELYNIDCIDFFNNFSEKYIEKIDAIIVDLPYYKIVKEDFDNQWNSLDEYLKWCNNSIQRASKLLKQGGSFIIFCSRQNVHKIANICENNGLIEQRMIIWSRKRCFNNTRGKALSSGYEPILYMTKGDNNITFNNLKIKVESDRNEYKNGILKDGINLSDCWTDISALPHNSKEKVDHPTQKPLKLMSRIIEMVTNENDLVLDYCCGSGTTGVACLNLNRKFIGLELDEKYYNIAKTRITNT